MYQFSATHNAVFQRPAFSVSWQRRVGGTVNGGIAVVGDRLYAVSFDHKLYALNARDGSVLWTGHASNILMSTPVVSHNLIIVGSGHNGFLKPDDWTSQVLGRPEGDDMVAFSVGGHRAWTKHTDGEDMPSPAIAKGRVIFANGDLHAYSLELLTGRSDWVSALPGADAMASVTVDEHLAILGTCHYAPHTCATIALNTDSGQIVWQNDHGGSDAAAAIDNHIVFVEGSPIESERFRPGGHDVVAALDEQSGRTLWQYDSGDGPFTIVASGEQHIAGTAVDGVLYQSINNSDRVIAFDERSGKILWSMPTYAPVKMSPIVRQRRVYFGDTSGLLYDVDAASGAIVKTTAMQQPFSVSPFVIVGSTLFGVDAKTIFAVPLNEI